MIKKASDYAMKIMTEKLDTEMYLYHNIHHVQEMRDVAMELANQFNLTEDEKANIEIACWLHDVGYIDGAEGHEERGVEHLILLFKDDVDAERLISIGNLIMATRMKAEPETISAKIMKDADCHHVGIRSFASKTSMLKQELELTQGVKIDEKQWLTDNLKFLHDHKFHTAPAESLFSRRKRKNILKIQKELTSLLEYEENVVKLDFEKADVALALPSNRADRGIETMFRVTLRNHNNLSVIADNKANIMLSINSIMLSIVLSSLASKLDTNSELIIPTILLTSTCVVSIIIAVFATRPKISTGDYSDEAFMAKKINLLFFGNFFKLPLDKFEWGINTLMNNEDMLYSSLTKDLYFLGVVLAKKYRLLWYCYNVFTIGIIITALSFIWVFATMPPEATDSIIPN